MHIFCGCVLELFANGIFHGFLNIYNILGILPSKILPNFKRLKSHPIHDFKQRKTLHIKKQSLTCLSFQNMLSILWATYEMNFWERKIHRAVECN